MIDSWDHVDGSSGLAPYLRLDLRNIQVDNHGCRTGERLHRKKVEACR